MDLQPCSCPYSSEEEHSLDTGEVEGSNPSSDMSPTKFYVAFWITIMLVFLAIGLGIIWQLHRLIAVLQEILKNLKG